MLIEIITNNATPEQIKKVEDVLTVRKFITADCATVNVKDSVYKLGEYLRGTGEYSAETIEFMEWGPLQQTRVLMEDAVDSPACHMVAVDHGVHKIAKNMGKLDPIFSIVPYERLLGSNYPNGVIVFGASENLLEALTGLKMPPFNTPLNEAVDVEALSDYLSKLAPRQPNELPSSDRVTLKLAFLDVEGNAIFMDRITVGGSQDLKVLVGEEQQVKKAVDLVVGDIVTTTRTTKESTLVINARVESVQVNLADEIKTTLQYSTGVTHMATCGTVGSDKPTRTMVLSASDLVTVEDTDKVVTMMELLASDLPVTVRHPLHLQPMVITELTPVVNRDPRQVYLQVEHEEPNKGIVRFTIRVSADLKFIVDGQEKALSDNDFMDVVQEHDKIDLTNVIPERFLTALAPSSPEFTVLRIDPATKTTLAVVYMGPGGSLYTAELDTSVVVLRVPNIEEPEAREIAQGKDLVEGDIIAFNNANGESNLYKIISLKLS